MKYADTAEMQDVELQRNLSMQRQSFSETELATSSNVKSDKAVKRENMRTDFEMEEILAKLSIDITKVKHCTSNVNQYLRYVKGLRKKAFERLTKLNNDTTAAKDLGNESD